MRLDITCLWQCFPRRLQNRCSHAARQNNQLKIIALATATNFEKSLGPSVPPTQSWSGLLPPPKPTPDFERVLAQQAESNWVPARLEGEIIPMTSRILGLYPRGSFVAPGICDTWHTFLGDERITDTYLAFMTDLVPSMSDTLLRNGGLYDAHVFREEAEKWATENPGATCLFSNTAAQVRPSISRRLLQLDRDAAES